MIKKYITRAVFTALALWAIISYLEIGFTDWFLGETESAWNLFKVMGIL